jgi:hypothetical protein
MEHTLFHSHSFWITYKVCSCTVLILPKPPFHLLSQPFPDGDSCAALLRPQCSLWFSSALCVINSEKLNTARRSRNQR